MIKKLSLCILLLCQIMLLFIITTVMVKPGLWIYLLRQARGQINVVVHTKPIEELLQAPDSNQIINRKIRFIQEVKSYAENHLGLKKTSNYSTYYDHGKSPILWMLTACEPYSMKEKTWYFPLIGETSYKGFFDYQPGLQEANQLRMSNYDVDLGKVTAWSTLGILSDPILSSMLRYNEGELAELIIHELTHATIYFKSSVDFNENFASFVGRQGAVNFLQYKYGTNNDTLDTYLKDVKDEDKLKNFILKNKELLDQFYKRLDKNLTPSAKLGLKNKKLDEIIRALHALDVNSYKDKVRIAQRIKIGGNAYFMLYNRYDAQYGKLMKIFQSKGNDLSVFIDAAKSDRFDRLMAND